MLEFKHIRFSAFLPYLHLILKSIDNLKNIPLLKAITGDYFGLMEAKYFN